LSSLHAYPLPLPSTNQPSSQPATPIWHTQENILTQLLRKKLDPDTESWIESASNAPHSNGVNGSSESHKTSNGGGNRVEMSTLAADKAREIAGNMPWGSAFTIEELAGEGGIKGVKTGLKRDLAAEEDDDEDDDSDDDDDDDDDAGSDEVKENGKEASKDEGQMDIDSQAEVVQVPKVPMMVLEDVLRFAMTGGMVRRSIAPNGGSGAVR